MNDVAQYEKMMAKCAKQKKNATKGIYIISYLNEVMIVHSITNFDFD